MPRLPCSQEAIKGLLMRPAGNTSSLADRAGLERARSIGRLE